MSRPHGVLIVIEGLDGSGKTVQTGNLIVRIRKEWPDRPVMARDFPRYDHPASYVVQKYLQKGSFSKGYREEFKKDPYGPALAYALDRMDAAHSLEEEDEKKEGPNMVDFLANGGIIVSNRYTQSNIGYQASKIHEPLVRRGYIEWLYHLEYDLLKIPKPERVIFLDLPPTLAREAKLSQLTSQNKEPDQHEANPQTFIKAQQAYRQAAQMFPEWRVIDMMAADGSRRKTTQEVAEDVYEVVRPLLV
jgi:dTMP kinase